MPKANKNKKQANPAERMIVTKKKLIQRLEGEIKHIRTKAEAEVKRVEFRIRQAKVILSALERGTLS